MPYRSLTPLGRQLRSVIANLSRRGLARQPRRCARPWRDLRDNTPIQGARCFGRNGPTCAAATAIASVEDEGVKSSSEQLLHGKTESKWAWHQLDLKTESLRAAEVSYNGEPYGTSYEANTTHANTVDQRELEAPEWEEEGQDVNGVQRRTRANYGTLDKLLKRYMRHVSDAEESFEAEWMHPFELSKAEEALLGSRGYTAEDVRAWAKIVSFEDSLEAATALQSYVKSHGSSSLPIFLPMYVLRGPYVGARALRIIADQVVTMLEHASGRMEDGWMSSFTVYVLFSKLVGHARKVWPRALERLPEMLLEHLPQRVNNGQVATAKQLALLTLMLNRAMGLLAVPPAASPFKNNHFQETGIVQILRFMAAHEPPLQIDREGYRAVVLVQLGQRKSSKEQQWAELKALSWPPWKEERTAMDSDITREDHGTSKAGRTLRQMREAGYGAQEWEKVASIYTGWDKDLTPTIQTLTLLGGDRDRFEDGTTAWIARITTTRTMQEAWACYLAYEDVKVRLDQDVCLAVFQKLRKEEERHQRYLRQSAKKQIVAKRKGLYPGDSIEVEPLPPSTHLYTYTRTPPPSFDGFYQQMRERGMVFDGYCLAYLIANASSLKGGLQYLHDAGVRRPDLLSLVVSSPTQDIFKVDLPVFTAFMQLLSRFSKVPLSSILRSQPDQSMPLSQRPPLLGDEQLNANHALVHAMELLKQRGPLHRPAFNVVLQALGHESLLSNIRSVYVRYTNGIAEPLAEGNAIWPEAITAYRLIRRVLGLMRELHLDLDAVGFMALCQGIENAALGCWMIMVEEQRFEGGMQASMKNNVPEAIDLVRSSNHAKRLRGEFCILVGDDTLAGQPQGSGPREGRVIGRQDLLETPNPAMLHAYLRALGWMADYQGMLDTVRWMAAHETELADRREKDRNGEATMRKTLIALRVFLQRSWLRENASAHDQTPVDVEPQGPGSRIRKQLKRLQSPARADLIEEVRDLVEGVEAWGGWVDDSEMEEYCQNERFRQFQ